MNKTIRKDFTLLLRCSVLLSAFMLLSTFSNAQCATPPVGCTGTDLKNFGFNSNTNAATIEYDNFVAGFHQSIVRTSDGSFQTWGELMANDGTSNLLSPTTINSTNFPALTGTPLKAAIGARANGAFNEAQGILLTTTGLFAWGSEDVVLSTNNTSSTTFQKLTINAKTDGLPTGVVPGDVKMMFGSEGFLSIVTCSGSVYVISKPGFQGLRGAGFTADDVNSPVGATQWYQVKTAAATPITNVVVCRGSSAGLMALKSDGTIWTWGADANKANNTGGGFQGFATSMTLPVAGLVIKMIGGTSRRIAPTSVLATYFVLGANGRLYALGDGTYGILGNWGTSTANVWVSSRYTSTAGLVMDDVKWISPNEGDLRHAGINVITNAGKLYAWGKNDFNMLGLASASPWTPPAGPTAPASAPAVGKILAVKTGGHTSMIISECESNFGYVGHRIFGSMGNGSAADVQEPTYSFVTAAVKVCGVETSISIFATPDANANTKYCSTTPVDLSGTSPSGGTFALISGPATLTGSTVNFTGAGSVVVRYSLPPTACGVVLTKDTTLVVEVCSTLPIKIMTFTGSKTADCATALHWKTATEINSNYFEIQQSTNGSTFYSVGRINSKNNASGSEYQFVNTGNNDGLHYYRLLMVDFNGYKEYSNAIAINGCNNNTISIYPNPIMDKVSVSGLQIGSTIQIMNAFGQIISTTTAKQTIETINTSGLPKAIYIISITNNTTGLKISNKLTKL